MPATHRYKEGSEVPTFYGAIWFWGGDEEGRGGMSSNKLYIRRIEDY